MSIINTPKGTRDFLPLEMSRRRYIFKTIENVYRKFGYSEIETPSMERISTLMGKYGEEGDRLIFKIINSGDYLKKADSSSYENGDSNKFTLSISEKALRYDLTVPFARYVVQHQNDLVFPFKRFQIQPVWRADNPQKGRYREFYQCDADIVGSDSLIHEVEFIQIFDDVLSQLSLNDFSIKINNRKILAGIAEVMNEKEKLTEITVAIDKLDKIGVEKVILELENRGISSEAIGKVKPLFDFIDKDNDQVLKSLKQMLQSSEIGLKGIEELEYVINQIEILGLKKAKLEIDPVLARGLNYYTGAIFEVKANNVNIGSICGGGRYDDLTGIFGKTGLSGVGISFGADRIYDVLLELDLFPKEIESEFDVLFINFGEQEQNHCMKLLKQLRDADIKSELYPSSIKMKKQMSYADKKGFKFVILIGEREINDKAVRIKNMITGDERVIEEVNLINYIKENTL